MCMDNLALYTILGPIFLLNNVGGNIYLTPQQYDLEEAMIDPHVYREPGCPIVAERSGFDVSKVIKYGSKSHNLFWIL